MFLHTIDSVKLINGGPSRSVPSLVGALSESGVNALLHVRDEQGKLLNVRTAFLIHDHGIWLPSNHAAVQSARKAAIPVIVSPRGMLEPWALRQKKWKKRFAWRLYQRRDLETAAALHATSGEESEQLRRLGLRVPIALIPNGVEVPQPLLPRARKSPRRALFLSRLHPKKGVLMLIEAWARVRPLGWELVIAGPDEDNHRAVVESRIRASGLSDVVSFAGPVSDADKWDLYRSADLFVLPTHSENFGLVVAEALGAGVPVLTTRGAPWRELETHRCGWWADISVDSIAAALAEATAMSRVDLDAMGERGRTLVLERYGWSDVARQMKSVYEWVLGRGDRPACVDLD